ncbi:asparagine synthetase B [Seongchinamella unica]|uniref:asparagine synthase (glutamine-hydrolyzing) n=1 Tax=Seongchinamella unica TaxID=2547392 RepID=A0A4R5LQN4_9GAMM|nr:asparagine synthase-related protein [Seongchinamella unica]TDG12904.1 asparagine synthetase B [Seongchinamella unica]
MSAIFGLMTAQSADSAARFERLSGACRQWGPDATSARQLPGLCLGQHLLNTSPTRPQDGVLHDEPAGLAVVADARLDNRRELLASLRLDQQVAAYSDSRLILEAYKTWGEDCVSRLIGDFAFAIWDEKRRRLFCARDHLGVRPLNYYLGPGGLAFCTDARAIRQAFQDRIGLNEARIADFLVVELEGLDKQSTFYASVYRLPPAHVLTYGEQGLHIRQYWQPELPTEPETEWCTNDAVEAFDSLYRQAVADRLEPGSGCAAMLSGGLDSSTIVAHARRLRGPDRLPVISALGSSERAVRERQHIDQVVAQGGLDWHGVQAEDPGNLEQKLNALLTNPFEPFDPMLMVAAVYLRAEQGQYRVVLDGIDGDGAASVPPNYPAYLMRAGRWREALRLCGLQAENTYGGQVGTLSLSWQSTRFALVPDPLRRLRRKFSVGRAERLALASSLVNREFARDIGLGQRLRQLRDYKQPAAGPQPIAQLSIDYLRHPYSVVGLERYHRLAASVGVEPRHPLMDKRLVEFMLGLPWQLKVQEGWNKYLMRLAAERELPPAICWRRGANDHVGWDFERAWLLRERKHIQETIAGSRALLAGRLDDDKLNALLSGLNSLPEERRAFDVVCTRAKAAFVLASWLQHNKSG